MQSKMTEVVDSQLNPLAIAFIPTNLELPQKGAIQQSIENEAKTTRKKKGKQNSNDRKSEYQMAGKMTKKLDYKNDIWKDVIFFSSVTSMLNVFLKTTFLDQTDCNLIGGSQLPVLLKSVADDDQKLAQKSQANIPPKTVEDKCNCPPMFGWIVPPDFIGNPFNFKYECSKKYPHSPNCRIKQESADKLNNLDTKISKWTLDECYSEMKEIIADVYETISMDLDPITKWDEKYIIEDFLEISDRESDEEEHNESNDFEPESDARVIQRQLNFHCVLYPTITKIDVETELIDDGEHPLLQSAPVSEEALHEPIENVEKILERSLSSPLPQLIDTFTFEQGAVCNPPCSVWCEFSPSASKDSLKCIQKSECINNKGYRQSSVAFRSVFKRSLSADDASMYLFQGLDQTSNVESKELLLLRRNDTLNYLRMQSLPSMKEKRRSWDFTDQQLFASSKSNMWGKFDGADSLWQPLPECNTFNSQKLNIKKGREIPKRPKQ